MATVSTYITGRSFQIGRHPRSNTAGGQPVPSLLPERRLAARVSLDEFDDVPAQIELADASRIEDDTVQRCELCPGAGR